VAELRVNTGENKYSFVQWVGGCIHLAAVRGAGQVTGPAHWARLCRPQLRLLRELRWSIV